MCAVHGECASADDDVLSVKTRVADADVGVAVEGDRMSVGRAEKKHRKGQHLQT